MPCNLLKDSDFAVKRRFNDIEGEDMYNELIACRNHTIRATVNLICEKFDLPQNGGSIFAEQLIKTLS